MLKQLTSDDGFSLLELLVAIAILSLAVIPMLSTQSTALKSSVVLKEKALARMVAENVLVEMTAKEMKPRAGTVRGNETQAGIEFNWRANVTNVPAQNMIVISLSVFREENTSLYQVTSYKKAS